MRTLYICKKNKMKFILVIVFLVQFAHVNASEDWGQNGHRVVGEVAEQHLSKKAERKINRLLKGKSLAVISTYADEIKSDSKYDEFRPWHYANVDFDKTYAEAEKNEKGDIVTGIEKCIAVLEDKSSSEDDKVFHLKMLVHLIGDMHQPLHFGLKEDRGGNDFKVKWFWKESNIHRVWDRQMIESYEMSYTELAENLPVLSKPQVKSIKSGDLIEWVEDTRVLTQKIYNETEQDEDLSYRYMYDWFDVVKMQLEKGGIRLAALLNQIYG